jgi:hypothetical protein
MSFSVSVGLGLAVLTAFTSVAGFLYKFRGAREAETVDMRRPVRSSIRLFRSPLYTLVIAGGLVLLTIVANRLFGISVPRREWIGVALMALGLAFLAATLHGVTNSAHSHYNPTRLAIFIGAVSFAGLAVAALARGRALGLAVASGLLWAASDTSIKALSSHLHKLGIAVLIHPLVAVILVASLLGLLISARSLQLGDAVPVIALTSVAANITTIAAGPLTFREPMPSTGLGLAVRLVAFVLVIAAAALTPPPASAESSAEPGVGPPVAGPTAAA